MPETVNEPVNAARGKLWKGNGVLSNIGVTVLGGKKKNQTLSSGHDTALVTSLEDDWQDMKDRRFYATLLFFLAMLHILLLAVQVIGLLNPRHKYISEKNLVNITTPDDTEAQYAENFNRQTVRYHALVIIMSVLVVFQLICVTKWYVLRVRNISHFDHLWEGIPLIFSNQCPYWLSEMVILSLHEPPFMVLVWDDAYKLQILALLRIYTIFAFLRGYSDTTSRGGRLVATVARISNNKVFQLRVWLRRYPVSMITTCTTVGWFLLSMAMYMAEEAQLTFDDAMWLTFITMTTVGYGDFSPKTPIGRTIACVTALHGLLSSALLINVITSLFTLDSQQERVLEFMTEARLTTKVEEYSVRIIETAFLCRKYPDDSALRWQLKHICSKFRKLKRHLKQFKAEMHLTIEPVDLNRKLLILDSKINRICESQDIDIETALEMDDADGSSSSSNEKKRTSPVKRAENMMDTINRNLKAILDNQAALTQRQDKMEESLNRFLGENKSPR
eukprot:TRINITY_DN1964_c0_g1_i1.p1 TRINITY_DN1964_c0_g1~~TRINITY_DN1964_c0_g1_i1.p1  ORF type:complete len:504 (+),score=91.16 TRINITY_DN1964_c0_g1_i1:64-1575(+)